ncbi:hypothetical protein LLEC1_01634 [Akanthomyces lecanii]|uniref:Uncharacterized protein n=1 Tax=Cordyceps confragosa TaxID=2714763 RepID=A0A179HZM8_CORDF|nr:hypothetical protein LLEC1_01634 [Akanthomyces lecanii]
MTSWGVNLSVSFQHGRCLSLLSPTSLSAYTTNLILLAVERKEIDNGVVRRRAESFVERKNLGGAHHVPGVNLSINFERYVYLHFSHGFSLWRQDRLSQSEIAIMRLVNDITDRKDWQTLVNDFSACRAWKSEAFENYFPDNNSLWEWCLFELQKKATDFTNSNHRSLFVLDSASRVCKSDRLVGSGFVSKLKFDTQSLHISPWMFPFVFDISPIRTDGEDITLHNFLDSMTVGATRRLSSWDPDALNNGHPSYYSGRSQWVATDVRFSNNGANVNIISPVNNLHPIKHKPVSTALEHLVSDFIEDWNQTLLYKTLARGVSRIQPKPYKCAACSVGTFSLCSCPVNFRESLAWANDRQNNSPPNAWYERGWNPVMALDGRYSSSRKVYDNVSIRDGFKDRGLQIYVEITTIDLDKNGTVATDNTRHLFWNLNGNRNERIVATTLVCLQRKNLHPVSGGITFRTETKRNAWEDRPKKRQNPTRETVAGPSHRPPNPTAASAAAEPLDLGTREAPSFQELGTIKLPEGRVVTYPNTLQHKFEAPTLANPMKPGSIKFMQIHLVDPHYIVCSTRFVPPQSLEWWEEAIDYQKICLMSRIPPEISHNIIEFLLVPEKWLNSKRRVRGLQHYWRTTYFALDGRQPRQPPIRYESALRIKRHALQKHESVLRAVNGEKIYGQPGALTMWVRTVLRDRTPVDGRDPRDLFAILAPVTEDDDPDPIGADAVNDIPDVEERYMRDFDIPLSIAASSSSGGSTDGGEPLAGFGNNSGNNADGDTGDNEGDDRDGGEDSNEGAGGGNTAGAAVAQDGDVQEESDAGENYVDAVPSFTVAETAEIEGRFTQAPQEEEQESLYDDAMSQGDEVDLCDSA